MSKRKTVLKQATPDWTLNDINAYAPDYFSTRTCTPAAFVERAAAFCAVMFSLRCVVLLHVDDDGHLSLSSVEERPHA